MTSAIITKDREHFDAYVALFNEKKELEDLNKARGVAKKRTRRLVEICEALDGVSRATSLTEIRERTIKELTRMLEDAKLNLLACISGMQLGTVQYQLKWNMSNMIKEDVEARFITILLDCLEKTPTLDFLFLIEKYCREVQDDVVRWMSYGGAKRNSPPSYNIIERFRYEALAKVSNLSDNGSHGATFHLYGMLLYDLRPAKGNDLHPAKGNVLILDNEEL